MNEDVIYGGPDGRTPYVPKLKFDLLCKEVQKVVMELKEENDRLKEDNDIRKHENRELLQSITPLQNFLKKHQYQWDFGGAHCCLGCGNHKHIPCKPDCELQKLLKI